MCIIIVFHLDRLFDLSGSALFAWRWLGLARYLDASRADLSGSVSVEGVWSIEALSAGTNVGLDYGVGALVSLEIVLSDEGGFTGRARVRSVCKVCLDVRTEVVSSSKLLATARVQTQKLAVFAGPMNERLEFSGG